MSHDLRDEMDGMILSAATHCWTKLAMIIGRVLIKCESRGIPASEQDVANRIYGLVRAGKLEGEGDLSRWRNSEVRRPD
jgi:hypothetical protein